MLYIIVLYPFLECIVYDDACHLKKYSVNRRGVSERLADMDYRSDRFHFKNHVDNWCRANCNPDKSELLKNVRLRTNSF